MQLTLDIGNTRTKASFFDDRTLIKSNVISYDNEEKWINYFHSYPVKHVIYSASGEINASLQAALKLLEVPIMQLSSTISLPFVNKYRTPETLGMDRIANMCAAHLLYPKQSTLVIDVGTCATYDFLENGRVYLGGMISPGLEMRLKAMNSFTERLPMVNKKKVPLIGTDTESCMQSGALHGLAAEIDGVINGYRMRFQSMNVILTGGDTNALQSIIKNHIFARPYLQAEGLNNALLYNLASLENH